MQASEALKAGEARMMSAKPVVAEKALAAHEAADDEGRRVAEAPSSADGCQKRSDGEEKEAPAVAAPEQPPVAKKPKRAPIEEAPKPLTKELPEVRDRTGGDGEGAPMKLTSFFVFSLFSISFLFKRKKRCVAQLSFHCVLNLH